MAHSFSTGAVLVASLLIGSAATLIPKVLLSLPCDDTCGGGQINAPIFSGLVVFAASALGLLIEAGNRSIQGSNDGRPPMASALSMRRYAALLVPGVFNVAGTLLQLVALLFIPAAVLAGLRGAFILFTAVLSSALVLQDRPRTRVEWVCIACAAAGAALVGAASALQTAFASWADGSASGTEGGGSDLPSGTGAVLLGLGLSILGYAVAAGQVSYEAIALDDKKLDSLGLGPAFTRWEVLGVEGIFGVAVVGSVLGGLQAASNAGQAVALDVPAHTACCLAHSPALSTLAVAYGASSLTFNALLLVLGKAVGPNFRVFVFTARGLLTWAVEVGLFYSASQAAAPYGQGLSGYSVLQAVGYALLIGGGVYRATLQSRQAAETAQRGGSARPGAATESTAAVRGDDTQKRLLADHVDDPEA